MKKIDEKDQSVGVAMIPGSMGIRGIKDQAFAFLPRPLDPCDPDPRVFRNSEA
jgi:hypothetical protein